MGSVAKQTRGMFATAKGTKLRTHKSSRTASRLLCGGLQGLHPLCLHHWLAATEPTRGLAWLAARRPLVPG